MSSKSVGTPPTAAKQSPDEAVRLLKQRLSESPSIDAVNVKRELLAELRREWKHIKYDSVKRRLNRFLVHEADDEKRAHGRQALTDHQEMVTAVMIRQFSLHGTELLKCSVPELVRSMWHIEVGSKWLEGFISRWRIAFKPSTARDTSAARQSPNIMIETEAFIDNLGALYSAAHLASHLVANSDATILFGRDAGAQYAQLVATGKKGAQSVYSSKLGSMQPFVLANGDLVCVAFCWKMRSQAKTKGMVFPSA